MITEKKQNIPLSILLLQKCLIIIVFFAAAVFITGCKAPYPFMNKGELYYPPYKHLTPEQMRQREYILNHKDLDARTKNAILSGSIFKGMNTEEVIASWGKPKTKSSARTPRGIISQWVYDSGDYLYFTQGILYDNKKLVNP